MPDLRSDIKALAKEIETWLKRDESSPRQNGYNWVPLKIYDILARYPAENGWRDVTGRAAEAREPTLGLRSEIEALREMGRKAAEGGKAAADELMTEFIGKKRAADWGIINEGLLACDALLRAIAAPTVEEATP